jgi:hypothetical protein
MGFQRCAVFSSTASGANRSRPGDDVAIRTSGNHSTDNSHHQRRDNRKPEHLPATDRLPRHSQTDNDRRDARKKAPDRSDREEYLP